MQLAPVCYTVHVSWTLNLNGYSESRTCFTNLVSKINTIAVSPCFMMGLVAQILATFVFLKYGLGYHQKYCSNHTLIFSLEWFTLTFSIVIIIAKGRVHNFFAPLFSLYNMLLLS